MKLRNPSAIRRLFSLVFLIFCSVAPGHGQLVYQTDFNGSAGAFPGESDDNWTAVGSTSPMFTLSGDGKLQMKSPSASAYASAYWTGSAGAVLNGEVSDGTVTAVFQNVVNANNSMGVLARVQSPFDSAHPQGYFAGLLRGTDSKTYLVIAKDINFSTITNSIIATSSSLALTSGNYYKLVFDFNGDSLTASLFSTATDTQISAITAVDSSYSIGLTGLRTNFGVATTVGYESFRVEGIPESSEVALLSVGAVVLIAATCRNRKRLV